MKTTFYYTLLFVIPYILPGQPVITNAESFITGTRFKYQDCNATGISAGNGGTNQTWNFSSLSGQSDTLYIDYRAANASPHGSLFPNAAMVEEFSSGQFSYFNPVNDGAELLGFIDTNAYSNTPIFYPSPARISKHSLSYGTQITQNFTDNFAYSTYNFSGQGSTTISADGYGTLILPNGTYSNTLRTVAMQEQHDTLLQFGSVSHFSRVTHKWFANSNPSPLLVIDSITTVSNTRKMARYLLNVQNITGIDMYTEGLAFNQYPNPVSNYLTFQSDHQGELFIVDPLGQVVMHRSVSQGETQIESKELRAGVYTLFFKTHSSVFTKTIIVQPE